MWGGAVGKGGRRYLPEQLRQITRKGKYWKCLISIWMAIFLPIICFDLSTPWLHLMASARNFLLCEQCFKTSFGCLTIKIASKNPFPHLLFGVLYHLKGFDSSTDIKPDFQGPKPKLNFFRYLTPVNINMFSTQSFTIYHKCCLNTSSYARTLHRSKTKNGKNLVLNWEPNDQIIGK